MSGQARRLPVRVIAGRHARLRGTENLRRPCLTALIALVVQFSLGMILNLYVTVPTSDAHAGYVQELRGRPRCPDRPRPARGISDLRGVRTPGQGHRH